MAAQVSVTGLRELQAALRTVDQKLPRELTKAHKQVAKTVLEAAQQDMAAQPVGKADEAAAGLKAVGGQRWAGIKLDGGNPYVRAVEFGTLSHVVFGRRVSAASMKRRVYRPWKGNDEDAGYALYPAIRRIVASEQFADEYSAAMRKVFTQAFPKTA